MNELSKDLLCIYMRSGIEIWIERERAKNFTSLLASPNAPQFVEIDGNLVNRADVTGLFSATNMVDLRHRKNGEWQCQRGAWHGKKQECECSRRESEQEFDAGPDITDEERAKNLEALAEARSKIGL